MKKLYVYALTYDTNFAPCFDGGIFSLACCKGGKTGMRQSIRKTMNNNDEVWVLGVCSKKLSDDTYLNDNIDRAYKPLFLAKITETMDYLEYYSEDSKYKGRTDQKAYKVIDGEIVSNDNYNPHANEPDSIEKDKGGKYVLISDDYAYLGHKCGNVTTLIEKECGSVFHTESGTEKSIEKSPRGHLVYDDHDACLGKHLNDLEKYLNELKSIMNTEGEIYHLSEVVRFDENGLIHVSAGAKNESNFIKKGFDSSFGGCPSPILPDGEGVQNVTLIA